jgi:AcrR family transcriptional regulator
MDAFPEIAKSIGAVKQSALVAHAAKRRVRKSRPRERILAAARDLFYRHGIHIVGMKAIADAAGMGKMSLYWYFASKEELVAECMKAGAQQFDDAWYKIERLHKSDPRARLLTWLDFNVDLLLERNDRGCPLANAAPELPDRGNAAHLVIEEFKNTQCRRMVQLCHEAGCRDPEILANELFLLIEGAQANVTCVGVDGPGSRIGAVLKSVVERHVVA